jgi:hypothetical protein
MLTMLDPVAQTAVLRIELEHGSEPIRGTIGPQDGPATPFTGWLGLAAALERALAEPAAA